MESVRSRGARASGAGKGVGCHQSHLQLQRPPARMQGDSVARAEVVCGKVARCRRRCHRDHDAAQRENEHRCVTSTASRCETLCGMAAPRRLESGTIVRHSRRRAPRMPLQKMPNGARASPVFRLQVNCTHLFKDGTYLFLFYHGSGRRRTAAYSRWYCTYRRPL